MAIFSVRNSLASIVTTLVAVTSFGQEAPEGRMSLWGEVAPQRKAAVTVHHPAAANGTAIVICPGGGYGGLVTSQEGHGIAKWLNRHGIVGVVLEYELPAGRSAIPLGDAQRAIRWVRARAEDWKVASDRIGIMGFSAGGHLASTAGTHFDQGDQDSPDLVARQSSRPDFMILVYPVISMGPLGHAGSRRNLLGADPSEDQVREFSNETQVTINTPPAYLAHARDDKVVVLENSQMFHRALRAKGVESRLLELPGGGHGLNGYQGPMWDAWQQGSLKWLAEL